MTKGRSLHLAPVLACLGLVAVAGCGERGRTPTSPEPLASTSVSQVSALTTTAQPTAAPAASARSNAGQETGLVTAVAEASRGGSLPRWLRDGSTPQRKGPPRPAGGATHPGGSTPGPVELSLSIQPDDWDVAFVHDPGTVSALLAGTGLDAVDRGSIVLAGTGGTATPLRVQRAGDHLEAIFGRAAAIGTLDHPIRGERQRVTLRLKAGGTAQALDAFVHLVGESQY